MAFTKIELDKARETKHAFRILGECLAMHRVSRLHPLVCPNDWLTILSAQLAMNRLEPNRQTDRQKHSWTNGQTDRQTDRHIK